MALWVREIKGKSGSIQKTWYGSVNIPTDNRYGDGRPKYRQRVFAVGKFEELSKKKAEQQYHLIRQAIIDEEAGTPPDTITIADYEPDYLRYSQMIVRKKTYKCDVLALKHIKRIIGEDKPLSEIQQHDLIQYQIKRMGEGVTNGTINRELAVFRNFINIAIAEGKLNTPSPFNRKFKFLKAKDNRDRVVTEEEEQALHDHLLYHQWMIVDVALNTACRLGELITMKWDYVDFERKVITIPKANVKRELSVKVIDMSPYLAGVLKKHKLITGKFGYVFLSLKNEPYKKQDSMEFFPRACKKLGIQGVTFHTLRHTAITRMLSEGSPLDSVSRIAGHRSVSTTMLYAHRNPADKAAINTLGKYRKGWKKDKTGSSS